MPWVKISSDAHKDMKQYLVDVEGVSLGELVEAAFEYCMENLADFEKSFGIEESDESEEAEEDKQDQEEETDKEDERE